MASTAFLHRVRLKNYRSIGACDVTLGQLTFLVGRNGSGKSNFIDALRFVGDALNQSLDHALRDRGGIHEVRRRSSGHPTHFSIRLDLQSPVFRGHYAFEVSAAANGAWNVRREECHVLPCAEILRHPDGARFEVHGGIVTAFPAHLGAAPPATSDRLFLVNAAGHAPFRLVFDALSRMGFYNLNPDAMRELQPPDPGHLLKRDGSNVASALARLEQKPERKQRLIDYLARVVPGVLDVEHKVFGPRETVEFRQQVHGAKDSWRFVAQNMSDGTIRALGVLLALLQDGNGLPIPLVGIEEPEAALHPAAAGVLLDALREAATRMQILATSHSAELLDTKDLPDDAILAVDAEENETRIGPVDHAGREALRERLYTAGELLRMEQLRPDADAARPRQLQLFGRDPA
jgi:predicted ATPase